MEPLEYKIIYSKKIEEKIILVEDITFKRGMSKDGSMAIYTPDEITFLKGKSIETIKAINLLKKMFDGKIINYVSDKKTY